MDRKKIEELAAIAVKGSILKTDTLSQFITENDKTPSWDGFILLYNDSNKNKSSILGRVDVQVKGKLSSNFQKRKFLILQMLPILLITKMEVELFILS